MNPKCSRASRSASSTPNRGVRRIIEIGSASVSGFAGEEWLEIRRAGTIIGRQRVLRLAGVVHRDAGPFSLLVEHEETNVEVRLAPRVEQPALARIEANPLEGVQSRVFRMHAA